MKKYILDGAFIKFNQNTHNGRIYDEKVYSREIRKWKYRFRTNKIKRILKLI